MAVFYFAFASHFGAGGQSSTVHLFGRLNHTVSNPTTAAKTRPMSGLGDDAYLIAFNLQIYSTNASSRYANFAAAMLCTPQIQTPFQKRPDVSGGTASVYGQGLLS